MQEGANQFVGSIPENYDQGLGPHIFEDYADDIARRAAALAKDSVLELAAGTGIVSRRLRDSLSLDVTLSVTDLNAPMLEIARVKFLDDEAVEFLPADALALSFDDAAFDLLVCQFGVMFFPDKVAGFREAARVLKPGGHYLFSTWGTLAENAFADLAHSVSGQFFPEDPPGFYHVPFSYADPATVLADLEAAGWADVAYESVIVDKIVSDPGLFARGLVFGNPLIDEIRKRGGVDPQDVAAAMENAFLAEFGPAPFSMKLQATVFTARRI